MHTAYIAYFLEGKNEINVFSELLEVVKVFVNFDNSIMELKDNNQK